ncbi:hypothetical protein LWX53_07930, partial [bacterium]|nr:hypothetical protein [bacterium]
MTTTLAPKGRSDRQELWRNIKRHRSIYLVMSLSLVYFIVFKYIPIWNSQIAFRDFQALEGVTGSPWVG